MGDMTQAQTSERERHSVWQSFDDLWAFGSDEDHALAITAPELVASLAEANLKIADLGERLIGAEQQAMNGVEEIEELKDRHAIMLRADAEKIRALEAAVRDAISALDDALGDTDPVIDAEATDEEVRDEQPVFWACQRLSAAIAATQSPRSEAGGEKK